MPGGTLRRAVAILAAVTSLSSVAHADPPIFDFGYACASQRQYAWYQDWSCVDSPLAMAGVLAGYVMDDSPPSGIVYCPYECPFPETPRGYAVQSAAGIFHDGLAGTTIHATAYLVGSACLFVHHQELVFPLWTARSDLAYGQVCGEGNLALVSAVIETDTLARVTVVGNAVVLDIAAQTIGPAA